MRGIGCFSPTLTSKEKKKIFFFKVFCFFVEYKPIKIQHDSTTFSLDATKAQIFLSLFVFSAFSNSKDKTMPIKNQLPTLSKLYSIYKENPEDLLDEADIDSYFYYSNLNITKKEDRLVRLSKTSNKNSFNLEVFKFDCSTIQQKNSLSEEITLTRRELGVVLHCLNDFFELTIRSS